MEGSVTFRSGSVAFRSGRVGSGLQKKVGVVPRVGFGHGLWRQSVVARVGGGGSGWLGHGGASGCHIGRWS